MATLALLLAASATALAGGTFYTNTDNQDNAGSGVADNDMDRLLGNSDPAHPIEFDIAVSSLPATSAVLTLRAYDVDEEQGEQDDVYLNGVFLGSLSGANNIWNATTFTIDLAAHPNLLVLGNNRVTVQVDTSGDATAWVTNVDWAQLLVDGGAADRGNTGQVAITGYSIAGNTVTIDTQATVNSITGGQYQLEISIIGPNGDVASVLTQTFTANPNVTVIRTASPTYALGSASGTYTVQAQLFYIDAGFPVQQDIATTQFVHTANVGPTDADNDGLTDTQETTLGTNRFDADTDGDGEGDAAEVGGNVNAPLDTDGDGTIDALESSVVDTDSDGAADEADPDNADPCVPSASHATCLAYDSDGDGLTNAQEDAIGTQRNVADTDGDGVTDGVEAGGNPNAPVDSDGDGIPNALESSTTDSDGDGVADQSDTANSNPCMPNGSNAACLAADSDGDGLTNGEEDAIGTSRGTVDSDGDGVSDAVEVGPNHGSPLDSDADGIIDALESGAIDSDGDGSPDSADADSDNDGIPDAVETDNGVARDTDGDGTPDHLDLDSDGDGLSDELEAGAGPTPVDSDGDGVADYRDVDSDNDGVADAVEGATDTNSDGEANYRDVDSDGDGILDSVEAMVSGVDSDGDGIDDALDPQSTGGVDANGDGIDDAYVLPDSDGDQTPDILDLDSDNDSVADVSEAGLVDADHDSRADAGQSATATPRDTDGDSTPDYLDVDSDGDGTFDVVDAGHGSQDANQDGRIDATADADGDGIPDVADPAPSIPGTFSDADGDGVADAEDLDLDNDGIPNSLDGAEDLDGDGLPNLADLDSDGDGISDLVEAGGVDANGDGIVDDLTDGNHNGLADGNDSNAGGTALPIPDTDHDGIADFRDLDSDGDGMSDRQESTVDSDNDGIADYKDSTGKLDTAVRGVGAFEWTFLLPLLALAAWRRRRQLLPLASLLALGVAGSAAADEADGVEGMRVGIDAGISWLKPRNRDGGYKVDDQTSGGFRAVGSYTWSPRWTTEVFYADAGSASISSDNPAVGHLGTIDYVMYGAGVQWAPFGAAQAARLYPFAKLGVVTIDNSASDPRIQYDRLNSWGVYLGGGAAWRITQSWTLQGELVSYDKDDLMLSLGVRWRL
ncbi:MAG TPA: hypothetical protein VH814_22180 [Steroidobacteraceae bacterium]